MKVNEIVKLLESGAARALITQLYGEDGVEANIKRYEDLLAGYEKMSSGERGMKLLSSPGRTEISGSYTDHNHGKVLAGSINLDCVGAAGTNGFSQVRTVNEIYSQDFIIDLNHLEPNERKAGTMDLVKGLLQGFKGSDYRVGGFSAYITNNVISATGVNSPASFEVLLCFVLNTLLSEDRMSTVVCTHIDKLAKNNYWDRASDPLDQMACAVNGLITIDFMEPPIPKIERIDFDFGSQDHSLIIVQTDKNHADLSVDYSSIPAEMKRVVRYFRREILSWISKEQVIDNLAEVRQFARDRSVPRVLHFPKENKRMEVGVLALRENRFKDFLNNITTSDNSLWKWLRSHLINGDYQEQGITVILALTELFIAEGQKGTCRVHGEGFADVIMAMLPNEPMDEFIHYTEKCTGERSAYRVSIHPYGAICFNDLIQPRTASLDIKRRDLWGPRLQPLRTPMVRRGDLRYSDVRVCGYQTCSGAIRIRGGLSGYDRRKNIGTPEADIG